MLDVLSGDQAVERVREHLLQNGYSNVRVPYVSSLNSSGDPPKEGWFYLVRTNYGDFKVFTDGAIYDEQNQLVNP